MPKDTISCTSCDTPHQAELFCPTCGIMQPFSTQNYWALFNLPCSFILDQTTLNQAYFALQHALHPDKFLHKSTSEQELAMQNCAILNEAYKTLQDKARRAKYMVELHIPQFESTITLPSEFMLHSMAWHERKLEVTTAAETSSLLFEIHTLYDQLWQKLETALQSQQWEQSADLLVQINVVNKLLS